MSFLGLGMTMILLSHFMRLSWEGILYNFIFSTEAAQAGQLRLVISSWEKKKLYLWWWRHLIQKKRYMPKNLKDVNRKTQIFQTTQELLSIVDTLYPENRPCIQI